MPRFPLLAALSGLACIASGCLFLVNEDADGSGGGGAPTAATGTGTGTGAGGLGGGATAGTGGTQAQGGGGGDESGCDASVVEALPAIASAGITQLVMGPPASIDTFAMSSENEVTGWQASLLNKVESSTGGLLSARLSVGATTGAVLVYKSASDGPDRVATIASNGTNLLLTSAYDGVDSIDIAQAAAVDGHAYGIVGSAREIHRFTSTSTSSPVEEPAPSDALHLVAFETAAAGLVWYSDAPSRVSRCWLDSNGDCTDTVDRDVPTASIKGLLYDPESDRAILVIGSNPPTLHVVSFSAGASGAVTTPELTGAVHFTLAGGHLVAASPTGVMACCVDQLTEVEACGPVTGDDSIDLVAGDASSARFVVHDAVANMLQAYDVMN